MGDRAWHAILRSEREVVRLGDCNSTEAIAKLFPTLNLLNFVKGTLLVQFVAAATLLMADPSAVFAPWIGKGLTMCCDRLVALWLGSESESTTAACYSACIILDDLKNLPSASSTGFNMESIDAQAMMRRVSAPFVFCEHLSKLISGEARQKLCDWYSSWLHPTRWTGVRSRAYASVTDKIESIKNACISGLPKNLDSLSLGDWESFSTFKIDPGDLSEVLNVAKSCGEDYFSVRL